MKNSVQLEGLANIREDTVRGKHGGTREITKKDASQQRVVHLSYILPGLSVPDVSWEQRVQGMDPREIKYSKEQNLEKFVDTINHGAFRKLILNDVIKIAHERSVNVTQFL